MMNEKMSTKEMSAKEYLGQSYRLNQLITLKAQQLQFYRELSTKTTGVMGDMPRSDSPDLQPVAGLVAKIVDVEAENNVMIARLLELNMEIARLIEGVVDLEQRLLLESRYLNFLTWEQIAAYMHFSVRWVHTVHARALDTVDRMMQESECLAAE